MVGGDVLVLYVIVCLYVLFVRVLFVLHVVVWCFCCLFVFVDRETHRPAHKFVSGGPGVGCGASA
jgi:hypothetical protein